MSPSACVWAVSGSLLLIGAACLVLRRQLLAMVLGLELLINAASLNFVYYAGRWRDAGGLAIVLLILAVAAAEVVVGVALLIALNHRSRATESGEIRQLAG